METQVSGQEEHHSVLICVNEFVKLVSADTGRQAVICKKFYLFIHNFKSTDRKMSLTAERICEPVHISMGVAGGRGHCQLTF